MRRWLTRGAATGILIAIACLSPVPAWAADDGEILIGVEIEPRPAAPQHPLARTGVDPLPLVALALGLALTGATIVATDAVARRRER